jgi:hypothetical protein
MFKDVTNELLDLTATTHGHRKAFLAQRRGPLCCSCSCCCGSYM